MPSGPSLDSTPHYANLKKTKDINKYIENVWAGFMYLRNGTIEGLTEPSFSIKVGQLLK
jgi:hypothetical protein